MKKIFLIGLLFISFASFAQRYEVKNTAPFNYMYYLSPGYENSDLCVVSLHGSDEGGLADGSQLSRVENYGYAKRWNNGERFPFRLIVPQGIKGATDKSSSYKIVMNNIEAELKRLGIKKVIYIGWSQGAMIALSTLGMTENNPMYTQSKITMVDGVISLAGKGVGNMIYSNCKDVPILLIHGDKDTSLNNVQASKIVFTELSKQPLTIPPILMIITGGSHFDAMNQGYDRTNPFGKVVFDLILSRVQTAHPKPLPRVAITKTEFDPVTGKIVFTDVNGVEY